eukprot:3281371-Amphidinium_carterae.1
MPLLLAARPTQTRTALEVVEKLEEIIDEVEGWDFQQLPQPKEGKRVRVLQSDQARDLRESGSERCAGREP